MKPIEIIEKIMEDHHLNASEFGEKVEKSSNYVAEIRSGKTSKISPPMVRKICRVFSEYNPDWVRTGEPPIYAAEVTIHGNGNIGNGNNNSVTTISERVLSVIESQQQTIHQQAETIAALLKNLQK